jgi:hypothetical protein
MCSTTLHPMTTYITYRSSRCQRSRPGGRSASGRHFPWATVRLRASIGCPRHILCASPACSRTGSFVGNKHSRQASFGSTPECDDDPAWCAHHPIAPGGELERQQTGADTNEGALGGGRADIKEQCRAGPMSSGDYTLHSAVLAATCGLGLNTATQCSICAYHTNFPPFPKSLLPLANI